MADDRVLWDLVGDLLEVLRLQAKELENLITHVEQVTTRMPEAHQLPLISSELAGLQHRFQTARANLEAAGPRTTS